MQALIILSIFQLKKITKRYSRYTISKQKLEKLLAINIINKINIQ